MKGTSTKCIETTPVVLESTPHESQNQLHSSLLLTPRLPIDGEPSGCKQELAESVMTAGRTKGTVEMAEPTDVDVDRTALLGEEPVDTACGVEEGAEMERNELRLQETTNLLCEEIVQHNGNAENNIPSSHGLPLKGEWTVLYASGELLTTTVEPYIEDGGTNTCVCLGATRWHAFDIKRLEGQADGSGCQTGVSSSQVDRSRGQTEALIMLNRAETADIRHSDDLGMYLGVGHAKCGDEMMDGIGSRAHMLTGHGDTPSVETNVIKPANVPQIVSIPRKREKPPDLPVEATRGHPDESNRLRDHTDTLTVHTDMHSIGYEMETAGKETECVSMCRNGQKMQSSPDMIETKLPECTNHWRKVSVDDGDMYVPWNVPVEALGQMLTFGQPVRGDEAIAPVVKSERAGDGNNDQYRDDSDVGDTTSGGSVHSKRVKVALLAAKSQHVRYGQRTRNGNSPVSSRPPIRPPECPYRLVMCQRPRRRIKFGPIKVSQAQEYETTYLGCTGIVQPC